eukprot:GHVU01033533.1.p2 GENE.GHVU01033533.1~~GHVU01033533.1.p2  ORF type:complete len:157 (+),score=7.21 GHVU01033533.1:136-606(+)
MLQHIWTKKFRVQLRISLERALNRKYVSLLMPVWLISLSIIRQYIIRMRKQRDALKNLRFFDVSDSSGPLHEYRPSSVGDGGPLAVADKDNIGLSEDPLIRTEAAAPEPGDLVAVRGFAYTRHPVVAQLNSIPCIATRSEFKEVFSNVRSLPAPRS